MLIKYLFLFLFFSCFYSFTAMSQSTSSSQKVGIIGLDTSHSIAFTKLLNDSQKGPELEGFLVVAAYPHGSTDIESSVSRIPRYTEEIQQFGVEITDSIEELLKKVDVVLLIFHPTESGCLRYQSSRE